MAHILAVDDDPDLCTLLKTALERDGHAVEIRTSGVTVTESLCRWADCILLDVKTGNGAFMKTLEDSIALAKAMVDIGEHNGRRTAALITDMDTPLGRNIGNSLEVIEAVETLRGKGPADLTEVCLSLASGMLWLAGRGGAAACRAMAEDALRSGAALAKLISRIVGAVVMLVLLRNRANPIHIVSYRRLTLRFDMIKRILQVGVPNGLENGMFQFGKILVQGLIATFGTSAIAANAVGNSVAGIAIIPGSAIGLAMITIVGRCVGAQDYDQARYYTKLLMKMTYGSMLFLNLAEMLACRWIISCFTEDASIIR